MNNDDLKRFMKEQINLDYKDCLCDIKKSEVCVEPCLTNTKHARNARKFAFYSLIGLTVVCACSYQAYRYCTPSTYITIEVGQAKDDLSLPIEDRSLDSFLIKVNLNDFNHVIDVKTNNNEHNFKLGHMKYQEAFPIIVEKILEVTNSQKELTFTIYSEDSSKYNSIESYLSAAAFQENYKQVHINDYKLDEDNLSAYATKMAIEEILKRTDKYTENDLKDKSIADLLDILIGL